MIEIELRNKINLLDKILGIINKALKYFVAPLMKLKNRKILKIFLTLFILAAGIISIITSMIIIYKTNHTQIVTEDEKISDVKIDTEESEPDNFDYSAIENEIRKINIEFDILEDLINKNKGLERKIKPNDNIFHMFTNIEKENAQNILIKRNEVADTLENIKNILESDNYVKNAKPDKIFYYKGLYMNLNNKIDNLLVDFQIVFNSVIYDQNYYLGNRRVEMDQNNQIPFVFRGNNADD